MRSRVVKSSYNISSLREISQIFKRYFVINRLLMDRALALHMSSNNYTFYDKH